MFVINLMLIGSMAVIFIAYAALLGALGMLMALWFVNGRHARR